MVYIPLLGVFIATAFLHFLLYKKIPEPSRSILYQPVLMFYIFTTIIFVLFVLLRFSNSLETQGWGGFFYTIIFGFLALVGLLYVVITTVIRTRTLKKSQSHYPQWAPWLLPVAAYLGMQFLILVGSVLGNSIDKTLHPYGPGQTKDTQFSGIYQGENINGVVESRLFLDVPEYYKDAAKYNDTHLCLWGRLEKSNQETFLRSIENTPPGIDYSKVIIIANNDVLQSIPCNSGTTCAGNLTVCGLVNYSASNAFGVKQNTSSQLIPTSLQSSTSENKTTWLNLPYLEVTKPDGSPIISTSETSPGGVAQVLTDAEYLLNMKVCVSGVYMDKADGTTPTVTDAWLLSIGLDQATSKDITALYASLDKAKIPQVCNLHAQGLTACAGRVQVCGTLVKTKIQSTEYQYPYSLTPDSYKEIQ